MAVTPRATPWDHDYTPFPDDEVIQVVGVAVPDPLPAPPEVGVHPAVSDRWLRERVAAGVLTAHPRHRR
ncbi:hypothetical protein OG871_30075 [Kitasatospora sp. NBC_00374]|uniref:hypothetical protein n=1 Tax=Kitasatospora sp. NBC_00374 TaxID=2975964 RepID=UPI00324BE3EB